MREKLIFEHFPDLTSEQQTQFSQLLDLYADWNQKINVISRKDIDNLYRNHVLHSLSIAKVISFLPGSRVLDVGTGGGFPGIPLAILFPETRFTLVDSIGKKIRVVNEVSASLGLSNVEGIHTRAEQVNDSFDFIVSRAVTNLPSFLKWVKNKTTSNPVHPLKNGVLYLKGGDFKNELVGRKYDLYPVSDFFSDPYFEEKYVVHVPL